MSGFGTKRKKYSWLPESNPSALSGDTGSSASATKPEGEKAPRSGKQRTKSAGASRSKKEKPANGNQTPVSMVVDSLGIATPAGAEAAAAVEVKTESETQADRAKEEAPADEAHIDDPADAAKQSATTTVASKSRRRSRKDSVDELVRSRLMSTMSAKPDSPYAQPDTPTMSTADIPRNGPRRRGEVPAPGAITASVRDALASERSAASASRLSPVTAPMYTSTPKQSQRNGRFTGSHLAVGGASAPGTPASRPNASNVAARQASPPVALDPLESKYSFPTYTPLNHRNVTSTLKRSDNWNGPISHMRGLDVPTGENVIVIQPGSRWLRIGRASDAVPKEVPHVIARRLRRPASAPRSAASNVVTASAAPAVVPIIASDDMDVDTDVNVDAEAAPDAVQDRKSKYAGSRRGDMDDSDAESDHEHEDEDAADEDKDAESDPVEQTLDMLRDALRQHQRHSKRKVPPNVYAQVHSYNKQSRFEEIQDHNDPFKIEWIQASEIKGDCAIGEKVRRIANPENFIIRHPLKNGYFNIEDYASIEEVLGDIESIWTYVIEVEMGIKRRELKNYGVVLVIPDLFNRVEVVALSEMLLRRIGFQHLLLQQSSALVTFGAGISTACVVDVGAQKTSIACIEDGYCYQESRVSIMYGGDDITRFLFGLFERSNFPYHEASLNRMSDWAMLNDLKEKCCTMNLSDVNIRLRDFFVRLPTLKHTHKYSFKTYDEAYQAPLCLFYPAIVDSLASLPHYETSFTRADFVDYLGELKTYTNGYLTPTQFGILPTKAVETAVVPDSTPIAQQATSTPLVSAATATIASASASGATSTPVTTTATPANSNSNPNYNGAISNTALAATMTDPATVPVTEPGTPDPRLQTDASGPGAVSSAEVKDTPDDAASSAMPLPVTQSIVYVSDPQPQYSRMPLDLAITHSLAHAGSIDRARKLYSSILVRMGGFWTSFTS
ncbi:actin-like protein arp8 [Coemansia sp. Benny D115]|nr:actin-like protein arp8 [Coemansia sp. Benny D115]